MASSQPPNRGGRGGGRGGRKSTSGTGSIRQKRTRASVLNDDSGDTAVLDSQDHRTDTPANITPSTCQQGMSASQALNPALFCDSSTPAIDIPETSPVIVPRRSSVASVGSIASVAPLAIPSPGNVNSSPDSLPGPPPTSPLAGSGPTTPTLLPASPAYHSNLAPAIYQLKAGYPFLFLTADRRSAFSLKGIDRVRLDFNRGTGELVATNRSDPRDNQDMEPRALIGGQARTSISDGVMKDLIRQLDTECRKNQFLFHRSIFAIDAILATFANHQLSPIDLIKLRATALNYHADFQNKFLWKGLLPWCKDFIVDNGRAMELAHQNMKNVAIARELRGILLPQLTKPTYEACWRFVADLLLWEQNFTDKSSTQFFYIRLVFTTLSPLIFKLISKENELNVDTPPGVRLKQDLTMRNTIREVYKDLCYEKRFQHVEKEIFKWTKVSAKRRRVADVDRTLEEYIWDDEEAPPPPPKAVARPAVPALFLPSVTTTGDLSSRGQTPDS